MIRLAIAIVLAFFAGRMAAAQDSGSRISATKSDLFFQPAQNELVLTPSIEYSTEEGEFSNGPGALRDSGRIYKLKIEKGLAENVSGSLELNLKNSIVDLDQGFKLENEGLEDLTLNIRGNMALDRPTANLHYGAFIKHSVDRVKETQVKAIHLGGMNVAFLPTALDPHSAGSSLTPYIGYSEVVGRYLVGARVLQTVAGTKRDTAEVIDRSGLSGPLAAAVPARREFVEEGGGASELKVFAERSFGKLTLHVASKYRHLSPERQIEPESKLLQDEIDLLGLEIYPSYRIDSSTEIVGGLGYLKLLNQNILFNGQLVESGDSSFVNLGGRFTF